MIMGFSSGADWVVSHGLCARSRVSRIVHLQLVASGQSLGLHDLTACGHTHCGCTCQNQPHQPSVAISAQDCHKQSLRVHHG